MKLKRYIASICAAALTFGSVFSVQAAGEDGAVSTFESMPSYSLSDSTRTFRHATAALHGRNSVAFTLDGNSLGVSRRSYKLHSRTDRVIVTQGSYTRIEQEMNWTTLGAGLYGYDGTVSLAGLADGTYTLTVKSSDGYIYTVEETTLYKSGGMPYFPKSNPTSKQYNYGLLQSLYAGNAPDDFGALKEEYGTGSDRDTLSAIQQKALELTQGLYSDRDKVLAIDWWISQNIAYDMDLPTNQFESWVAAHPGDKVRLDSALNAFTQKYAFCYGYAKLTVLMLGYAGVQSVYMRGRLAETTGDVNAELGNAIANDNMNHAFNAVKVNGSWYFLDTSRNAVKQYYRTVAELPSTGYTESKLAPAYLYVFPDLDFFSETHIALRVGAKSYGTKIVPQSIPDGWQPEGTTYYVDGVQIRSQFARIEGTVYYFDAKGVAAKGWQQVEGYWRYFDESGAMITGTLSYQDGDTQRVYQLDDQGRVTADNAWVTIEGADRYFRGTEMLTGWQFLDDHWRYFDETGVMYKNASKPLTFEDGSEYHFNEDGSVRIEGSGWLELGDVRIYLNGGEALMGLQRVDGRDYLFDWSGAMLTGWQREGDATYLLGEDGVLKSGWQFVDSSWYYIDRLQGRYTGVQTVGGKQLYFDSQGRLSTGGWVNVGTGRVYFADSTANKNGVERGGRMLQGWRRVDDVLYYFDPTDGRVYTNRDSLYNPNNQKYYSIDANGVATAKS